MSGFFLCLDGIDGVGKSYHLDSIKKWTQDKRIDTLFTREPGGTILGEKLRDIILNPDIQISLDTETLLLFAARSEHIQKVIIPALNNNKLVVTDRFTDATYAYQGAGRGYSLEKIAILEKLVQNTLKPDLTIVLDVPIEVSQERIKRNDSFKDRFERQSIDIYNKIRAYYLSLVDKDPDSYVLVRTDKDKSLVYKQIIEILEKHINL